MIQKILPANNNSSSNVVHRIDLLVLKFCDTSVYCETLLSLHECMENILYEGYDVSRTRSERRTSTVINGISL